MSSQKAVFAEPSARYVAGRLLLLLPSLETGHLSALWIADCLCLCVDRQQKVQYWTGFRVGTEMYQQGYMCTSVQSTMLLYISGTT